MCVHRAPSVGTGLQEAVPLTEHLRRCPLQNTSEPWVPAEVFSLWGRSVPGVPAEEKSTEDPLPIEPQVMMETLRKALYSFKIL